MKKKVLAGLVCALTLCLSLVLVGCGDNSKKLDQEVSLPYDRISFSIPSDWESDTTFPLPLVAQCTSEDDSQAVVVFLDWSIQPEEFLNKTGGKVEQSGSIDSVGDYQLISYKAKDDKTNKKEAAHAIFIDGSKDYQILVYGEDININEFIKTIKK